MDEETKRVDATTDATDMPVVDEGTEEDEAADDAVVTDPEETA